MWGVGCRERGKNQNNNRQQTYFMADCVTIILEEKRRPIWIMHSLKSSKIGEEREGEKEERRKRTGGPPQISSWGVLLTTAASHRQLDSFHAFIRDLKVVPKGEVWASQSPLNRWISVSSLLLQKITSPMILTATEPAVGECRHSQHPLLAAILTGWSGCICAILVWLSGDSGCFTYQSCLVLAQKSTTPGGENEVLKISRYGMGFVL